MTNETERRLETLTSFFATATQGYKPYCWQLRVAHEALPVVLHFPKGVGKMEVALAWVWRLLVG